MDSCCSTEIFGKIGKHTRENTRENQPDQTLYLAPRTLLWLGALKNLGVEEL